MAHLGSSPLPVLLVLPPDPGGEAPHGLIDGGPLLADLLAAEVAACVAAVGHRLRTARRPAGGGGPDSLAGVEPWAGPDPAALVIWGLTPGEGSEVTSNGGPAAAAWPGVPVIPVTVGAETKSHVVGKPEPSTGPGAPAVLSLPRDSRRLCRALARSTGAGGDAGSTGDATGPGRLAVLVHDGDGPGGDERWAGLAWALTLLWAGPGRGVLMDLRGPGEGLSPRLRGLATPPEGILSWDGRGPAPVPGPALLARLPGAGGVRWWGWADPPGARGAPVHGARPRGVRGGEPLWAHRADCVRAVSESAAWTVLDVGRDAELARQVAAEGVPVIRCTDRATVEASGLRPDVVLRAEGRPVMAGASGDADGGSRTVNFRAADWSGASIAAWARSARRARGRRLAAEIAVCLDRAAGPLPGVVGGGRSAAAHLPGQGHP